MRVGIIAILFLTCTASNSLFAQQGKQTRNGLVETRDHRGIIKEASYFKNDTLNGESIKYFNNGKIYIKGAYKDGLADGDFYYYDSRGRQTLYLHFTHGVRDVFKSYWSNGNVRLSATFRNGFIENELTTYYRNGKLESRVAYKEGKILTAFRKFDKEGRVKLIMFPLSSTRDIFVLIEYFDKKGNTIKSKKINDRPMSYYLFGPEVHQSGELTVPSEDLLRY
jgi:hypothetical protein